MSLNIIPVYHSNDGQVILNINGKEYHYIGDNAIIIRFLEQLRQRRINKGILLNTFKRRVKCSQPKESLK